jgi:hypothetical protein
MKKADGMTTKAWPSIQVREGSHPMKSSMKIVRGRSEVEP